MTTVAMSWLSFGIGVLVYTLAVLLAKVPAKRDIGPNGDIYALKRFHDERGFETLKLFVQIVVGTVAALGFLAVNGRGVSAPGLREAGQMIVGGAGYLLTAVVLLHKSSKVWAAGESRFVSWLSSELFIVPGMVALTTVMVYRIVPALVP